MQLVADSWQRAEVRDQRSEVGDRMSEFPIADCETGNPPNGWESEGQFRNSKSGFPSMLFA